MIKPKHTRLKKLFIISWLIARLEWTMELSKLTLFRIIPKPQIHHVSRISLSINFIDWIYEKNKLSCITFDNDDHEITLLKLPPFSEN